MSARSERLNANKHIRYPFVDDAWMTDFTGTVTLPDDFLLDFNAVTFYPGNLQSNLHEVSVAGDGLSVAVTFDVFSAPDKTVTVPVSYEDYYTATAMYEWNGSPSTRIQAVFGDGLKRLAAEHPGETFTFRGSPSPSPGDLGIYLHWSTTISRPFHRTTSMWADNAEESWSQKLTGDIRFMEGWNTRVTVLEADNMLRIAPIVGEGKGMPCEPVLYPSGSPYDCDELIYHINGLHCNWLGEFQISGGDGITVAADPENHKIVLKTSVDRCRPGCTKDLEG